ncbi:hypothetical protein GmHk_03G007209 [Glycine max]|nr:hypothetical protein GmHk_03G007209 [Glycine max]
MVVNFFLTHLLLEVASPIIFLPSPFHCHDLQEAKDFINEEDPRPTSSNGATSCGIRVSSSSKNKHWAPKNLSGPSFFHHSEAVLTGGPDLQELKGG